MAVSFIGGENQRKPPTCCISICLFLKYFDWILELFWQCKLVFFCL